MRLPILMKFRFYTDIDLLEEMKNGNENSFREIYHRYWKHLYFLALKKVRSSEVAEELVQNVFVSLWNKRATTRILCLESYLHTAIKYQVINYLESKIIREKHTIRAFSGQHTEVVDCENIMLMNELNSAIERAIKKLPYKTQAILQLSRFENYSTREISEVMHISEKAVEYHITKSLKLMRTYLKDFLFILIVLLTGF